MEMNELYQEIGKMCEDWDFDAVRAEEILNQIDVNQEFTPADFHYKQTLLSWAAVFSSNLKMVKLLLNHGADPNQFYDNSSESVLWQMQYSEENVENYEEINKARLKIVELLLRHGANPHTIWDDADLLKHANEHWWEDEGIQYYYRWEFICLLEKFDEIASSRKKIKKPYIPKEHEKYDLLPFCRQNGGEVFEYPGKLLDQLAQYTTEEDNLNPYGYESYEAYFADVDRVAKKFSDQPEAVTLFERFKTRMREMNCKEEWSILKYIGPKEDRDFRLTPGHNYYWPSEKANPVYSGVIDDEEYTSYLYPTDSDLWEILEDPTGMAYNTIYGTGKKVPQKRYEAFMQQIRKILNK